MTEFEIYRDEMIRLVVEWANKPERDSEVLSDRIISKFAIKDLQSMCMVRAISFSFQVAVDLDHLSDNEEIRERVLQYFGFNAHLLAHLALGEWDQIHDRLTT